MASELVKLLGETLLSGDTTVPTAEAFAGKATCLLYFSAHWCGPCRGFTPILVDAYKKYKEAGGAEADVVFISWDRDLSSFKDYYGEMPWLAVPFEGGEEIRKALGPKFEVNGIPGMVALGPDGVELHARDGDVDLRSLVSKHKADAFPMTPASVAELQKVQEAKVNTILKELVAGSLCPPVCAPGAGTANVTFTELFGKYDHLALLFSDGDGSDPTYKMVAETISTVNEESGSRLGCLYLGWTLYNESSDHTPIATHFHSLLEIPGELKEKLNIIGVGAPHILVMGKTDGDQPCIVSNDGGAQKMRRFGAKGYPWSAERVQELEEVEKARIEAVRAKQANLQFLKSDSGDGLMDKAGTETKVDTLAAGGPDAIVGLYFSAHWCGPCRGFTPTLAKCHEDLKAAGKGFEVVFISSDNDDASFKEYFSEMPWLTLPFSERELSRDLNKVFGVQGIPTLVLLKPDGTLITNEGRRAVDLGAEYFPWGPEDMKRGMAEAQAKRQKALEAALAAEAAAIDEQKAKGEIVFKRLRGDPACSLKHDSKERKVVFPAFCTFGSPDLMCTSGVIYYEIEILDANGIGQIGFATKDFGVGINSYVGDGVGDDALSWGFDGARKLAWYDGQRGWDCAWAAGDVIGFAANVDLGKIAVAKNDSWSAPCGVVFEDDKIKSGVYPCVTGAGYTIRYNLDGASHGDFMIGPPPEDVWNGTA